MNIETMIKSSTWWQLARQMPDRHHDPSSGISIADHLQATHNNLRALLRPNPSHPFLVALHRALVGAGLELEGLGEMLTPVTLLHDIGKVREEDPRGRAHPPTRPPKYDTQP